jgi:protein-S-isoprenylcysteine O-methyltransferase Ste14
MVVWRVESLPGQALLQGLFWIGWLIVLLSTFMINHFDLFGLRQAYLYLHERRSVPIGFKTIGFYRIVRHPLMLGFLIAFWATPLMTVGHLMFAIATSAYILLAIQLEEHDLVHMFGDTYKQYRKRVFMLLPIPKGKRTL